MIVGILVFDEVDLLDAGGPYEVFLTASRLAVRGGEEPPFTVLTIGTTGSPVRAYGGLTLTPHRGAHEVDELDVLVVPGAIDIDRVVADESVIRAVTRLSALVSLTASVCTGAFVIGAAGALAERPWTTHREDVDALASQVGPDGARRDVRWVDAGEVVTSAGLASGIAMALHLVDRLAGRELATATARQLEYAWSPDPGR